jgi:SAM-dependent methyltransferase
VTSAYGDAEAAGWSTGAGAVYEPLATALVATCPVELAGGRILDAGSGPGAVASRVADAGGTVVACDLSPSMIKVQSQRRWPAAVADVLALPFRQGSFDAAIAAFLLNHVDPEAGLRALVGVVRPGGAVVASTWAGDPDPVKSAIDTILAGRGWQPPVWYRTMKTVVLAISGDRQRLGAAAIRAGLMDVSVSRRAEDLGVRDPATIVRYRLATPHIFPWISTLEATTRRRLIDDAVLAVEPLAVGWQPAVLFLRGRVPAQRSRRSAARASASA